VNSEELSDVIYKDILRYFFLDSDREITYRSDFVYTIGFEETGDADYYHVKTHLCFKKVLQNDEFTVVCANDEEKLKYFFKDKKCEYRWLLDESIDLSKDSFNIENVSVNGKRMEYEETRVNTCMVYKFKDEYLKSLKGQEVAFLIETKTKYPKRKNMFKVYINEITKGVAVRFEYSKDMFEVDTTVIFSGRERFPSVKAWSLKLRAWRLW
jgi:hypothetical protein